MHIYVVCNYDPFLYYPLIHLLRNNKTKQHHHQQQGYTLHAIRGLK